MFYCFKIYNRITIEEIVLTIALKRGNIGALSLQPK